MRIAYSYHIVKNSPWPILVTINLLGVILKSFILLFSKQSYTGTIIPELFLQVIAIICWIKEIINENIIGDHTKEVNKGINIGLILFIISEIMIFITLFFGLFYNSLIPDISVGSIWPPKGIISLDYRSVPLLNTIILISSGFTITAAHNYIHSRKNNKVIGNLIVTIILGVLFTYYQYEEYYNALFTIGDSVYGSSFYVLTGTHGLHIIIGTLLLIITLVQQITKTIMAEHNKLFTFSAIYWHFVDAVWLFLFFFIYYIA